METKSKMTLTLTLIWPPPLPFQKHDILDNFMTACSGSVILISSLHVSSTKCPPPCPWASWQALGVTQSVDSLPPFFSLQPYRSSCSGHTYIHPPPPLYRVICWTWWRSTITLQSFFTSAPLPLAPPPRTSGTWRGLLDTSCNSSLHVSS